MFQHFGGILGDGDKVKNPGVGTCWDPLLWPRKRCPLKQSEATDLFKKYHHLTFQSPNFLCSKTAFPNSTKEKKHTNNNNKFNKQQSSSHRSKPPKQISRHLFGLLHLSGDDLTILKGFLHQLFQLLRQCSVCSCESDPRFFVFEKLWPVWQDSSI